MTAEVLADVGVQKCSFGFRKLGKKRGTNLGTIKEPLNHLAQTLRGLYKLSFSPLDR